METYFIKHGCTPEEAKEEYVRLTGNDPSTDLHQPPSYWFDNWLANNFDEEFVQFGLHRACCRTYDDIKFDSSKLTGCISCQKIFPSNEVTEFVKNSGVCPYCRKRTLLPEKYRRMELSLDLLKKMNKFWLVDNTRFKVFPNNL